MIKTIMLVLMSAFLTVLMSSCANKADAVMQRKVDMAHCKMDCMKRMQACRQTCRNHCTRCTRSAVQTAKKHYKHYVHEECVKGGELIRQLNSYRDPLQCTKTTCDCCADYVVCRQSCSGTIYKKLKVPNVCC